MGLLCLGLLSSVEARGSHVGNPSAHTFWEVELLSPLQADSAAGRSVVWPCTLPALAHARCLGSVRYVLISSLWLDPVSQRAASRCHPCSSVLPCILGVHPFGLLDVHP